MYIGTCHLYNYYYQAIKLYIHIPTLESDHWICCVGSNEMAIKPVSLLFCGYYLLLASGVSPVNCVTPVTYPAITSSECSLYDPMEDEHFMGAFMEALKKSEQQLGPPGCNPPMNTSCQEILHCFPSAPSGYYQIHAANDSAVQVYCDMEGTNCGGEGGWMRVAHVNMTQPNASCLQLRLEQKNFSGLILCGRSTHGCNSTVVSTLGLSFSQVCGQLRGYQFGRTNAFGSFINDHIRYGAFVDGVVIAYGSPSKLIWTYAVGLDETAGGYSYRCPCNNGSSAQPPSFVGSDYYCESGSPNRTLTDHLHPNDPLWDGLQCGGVEGPCCTHPNLPWFLKTLNETTTEDILLRVCSNGSLRHEDILLQLAEILIR